MINLRMLNIYANITELYRYMNQQSNLTNYLI